MNETEVREKIVLPWLRSLGFSPGNLEMEKSFKIRLGHGIYEVKSRNRKGRLHARADYLVKSNGLNLFIVEVKAEKEPIDEDSINQAISYARLLTDGNIAPIAIITNGQTTVVLDVISKLPIDEEKAAQHPFFKNGHHTISCDIHAHAEALNHLISLSADNLLAFCKSQVDYRMKLLKGDDIESGKKYIPQLYIRRKEAERKIGELLFSENTKHNIALVTGSPQLGKTSFLCSLSEKFLAEGTPCLFYPAIGIKKGLFRALEEDFQWNFGSELNAQSLIIKISKILKCSGRRLVLIIDGLNEIDKERAYEICFECQRLDVKEINIVISATANSLSRILLENDNPNYLCEQFDLSKQDIELLKFKNLKNLTGKNIIQIDEFTEEETCKAIEIYSKAFNVQINTKDISVIANPFYLRGVAEMFKDRIAPSNLDNAKIISENICRKLARKGIERFEGKNLLYKLGKCIYDDDAPITSLKNLNIPYDTLDKLIDIAVLAQTHDSLENEGMDFYYSRERDYTISHIVCKWPLIFKDLKGKDLLSEIKNACNTVAGKESIRWFLSEPLSIEYLKKCHEVCIRDQAGLYNEIILPSILRHNFESAQDKRWLETVITEIVGGETNIDLDEAEKRAGLIYKFILTNVYSESISANMAQLIKFLLKMEGQTEDYFLSESFSRQLYENAIFSSLFENELLLDDDPVVATSAGLVIAEEYNLLKVFKRHIDNMDPRFVRNKVNYIPVVKSYDDTLSSNDSYCGGPNLETVEEVMIELREYEVDWGPIFRFFGSWDIANHVRGTMLYLRERLKEELGKIDDGVKRDLVDDKGSITIENKFQLYIPFDDIYVALNKGIASTFAT
jgi:hypothetical protein